MEAWKFVNHSDISPLFALSFTTEEWGLEPFPGNLLAIPGYWQDIILSKNSSSTNNNNNNKTSLIPAWTVPNLCSNSKLEQDPLSFYHRWIADYGYNSNRGPDSIRYISAESANLFCQPGQLQPCAPSGCLILLEGIGKNTTGPAHSSIVVLSHGISFFFAFTITIAIIIIMGCLSSSLSAPKQPTITPVHLGQYLNPPSGTTASGAKKQQDYAEIAATKANVSKEVARCSGLLRQMYALELIVWGMGENVADEMPKMEEMKRRANAIFTEIRSMVYTWMSTTGTATGWSAEEEEYVVEIFKYIDQHGAKRYEDV